MKSHFRNSVGLLLLVTSLTLHARETSPADTLHQAARTQPRLSHKIVPLSNPVYQLIDYYESAGMLPLLPQAKPYTKEVILKLLERIGTSGEMSLREHKVVDRFVVDFNRPSNGFQVVTGETEHTYAVGGFSAETSVRAASGEQGSWSASLVGEPYLSGDLGRHLTFTGAVGLAVERLRPDLFWQSYTREGAVHFPYASFGYSHLPYQYNYETIWAHVLAEGTEGEGNPIRDGITAGMIYHTELNGSWFDGALQVSLNNQRRAWGHDLHNLVISSTARRFPGVEMKLAPAPWIRYSFLTGSLFSYANQRAGYKESVYGYDIGQLQKMLTYHLLEVTPAPWLQLSAGGGNIWSKRLELAYLVPFVLPHLAQIDVGDHDNLSLNFDMAVQIPGAGKMWAGLYVDEFSFTKKGKLMKMPRNRYGWQVGWKSGLVAHVIPGTSSTLKYTRLTPFIYTHYPESDFNTFGSSRPLDMTYTHDEFNLGFYLPPNSGEVNWTLVNIAIPDFMVSLDNKLIMHGTNDLAKADSYLIYGDVYRHQSGDVNQYPLMDFTRDGIYDWTIMSELKFDWKIRKSGLLNYFRITGSLGWARTWWESNASEVTAPPARTLMNGSLGLTVDM